MQSSLFCFSQIADSLIYGFALPWIDYSSFRMAAGVYMVDSIFKQFSQIWLALISLVCWIDVLLWFHKIVLLSLLSELLTFLCCWWCISLVGIHGSLNVVHSSVLAACDAVHLLLNILYWWVSCWRACFIWLLFFSLLWLMRLLILVLL